MGRFILGMSLLTLFAGCDGTTGIIKETGMKDTAKGKCDEDGDGFCPSEGDCNDAEATVNPLAEEICDNLDNNCNNDIDEGVLSNFYADNDGDGFGAGPVVTACEAPNGYVDTNTDCDDTTAIINPGATEVCDGMDNNCDGSVDEGVSFTFYQDADGDSYGDINTPITACTQPAGAVVNADDCDDTTDRAFPGNLEVCDEIDNDCNGLTDDGVTSTWYADFDGDNFGSQLSQEACAAPSGYVSDNTDCNDNVAAINPAAAELCNGIDDNCDGVVDENTASDASTWYIDADGDGYGINSSTQVACTQPAGYVSNNTDCNDAVATAYPGAVEHCNGIDDNCDGAVDESTSVDAQTWYLDSDHDNYGNVAVSVVSCAQPSGYVNDSTDCNDASSLANPGAAEVCDSLDNNCDGRVDESTATDAQTWYADADGDNFGDPSVSQRACTQPAGYVSRNTDCDDTRALSYPGAVEYCNGYDDNCNGTVDENTAVDVSTWYVDADSDGYGNRTSTVRACSQPAGYVSDNTDCNDAVGTTYPGALEYCNNVDDDCDGTVDENTAVDAQTWYLDADRDGYGNGGVSSVSCNQPAGYVSDNTDCNDGAAAAHPNGIEVCDSLDNDCNGLTDESTATNASTWYRDADSDNYGNPNSSINACTQPSGYVANSTDCDDNRAASNPGAVEYCNGYDDNCNGTVDENTAVDVSTWYADTDADSYGNRTVTTRSCSQPAGYVADNTDCDDTRAATHPLALEYCNSIDDDCDGTIDENTAVDAQTWYLDADRDTYGNGGVSSVSCTQPAGYVANNTDCNDATSSAYPGATELCDSIDNDCDGQIDENSSANAGTWYRDADGDGYGNASVSTVSCSQPSGYVANNTDCDDARAASYPNAPEYCNTYDDNCNGTVDESTSLDASTWYRDADSDAYGNSLVTSRSCSQPVGYVANSTDCDDTRALTNPGASEYCNSIDDNCNGTIDESTAVDAVTWYRDADGDNYGLLTATQRACTQPSGYVTNSTDCNDLSSISHPGGTEICDSLDNDCNGIVDDSPTNGLTYYRDLDVDGFGNANSSIVSCSMPSGYATNAYDCNDNDGTEPVVADAINGTAAGYGTLAYPYDSLQDAITMASECVVAYPGTYYEQIDLSGRNLDVWGVSGSASTIIDANMPLCSSSSPSTCGPAVTISSNSNATPTLHGFTITGGTGHITTSSTSTTCADSTASHHGTSNCTVTVYEYCGGGVYINGDDPTLSDLEITGNQLPPFSQTANGSFQQLWMYSYGGGVCVQNSSAILDGVDIYLNDADQGGGLYGTDLASFSYEQGAIMGNTASDGAGILTEAAYLSVNNADVYCNVADTDGGGVFTETSGYASFTNVNFYMNNSATGLTHGADAYIGASTTLYLYNSIVENNTNAYALYGVGSSTFSYNNVYNASGYRYGGTALAGSNSLTSGSNFTSVNCDGSVSNDNFTLRTTSSSINAGNPSSAFNDVNGTRNDMGSHGGPEGSW